MCTSCGFGRGYCKQVAGHNLSLTTRSWLRMKPSLTLSTWLRIHTTLVHLQCYKILRFGYCEILFVECKMSTNRTCSNLELSGSLSFPDSSPKYLVFQNPSRSQEYKELFPTIYFHSKCSSLLFTFSNLYKQTWPTVSIFLAELSNASVLVLIRSAYVSIFASFPDVSGSLDNTSELLTHNSFGNAALFLCGRSLTAFRFIMVLPWLCRGKWWLLFPCAWKPEEVKRFINWAFVRFCAVKLRRSQPYYHRKNMLLYQANKGMVKHIIKFGF